MMQAPMPAAEPEPQACTGGMCTIGIGRGIQPRVCYHRCNTKAPKMDNCRVPGLWGYGVAKGIGTLHHKFVHFSMFPALL